MTDIQTKTRKFISDTICSRLSSDIPPAPESKEDFALNVTEGLVYLSFLPCALSKEFNSKGSASKNIPYTLLVTTVAAETYVATSEYFNEHDGLSITFPFVQSRMLEN